MATFVAKKSGRVKEKPMIILKEFQQAASAIGRRAMIHTEIREQPSFFQKKGIYNS